MGRSRRQRSRRQRQRGGDYNFTGTIAGNGAPAGAVVTSASPHCQSGGGCGCMIQAPQRGGDCMLQNGGGGGGGGYNVDVGSHELGKMGVIVPGSCQKGGEAPYGDYPSMAGQPHVSALDMNTQAAGYSNGPAVLSPSASFNLVKPYNANGGVIIRTKKIRKTTRRSRQSRQSRRSRR